MKRISLALSLFVAACGGSSSSNNPKGGNAIGMAVISSDNMMSTAISLVDPATGKLSQDDCLDSGSVVPILSTALSGDVVLPSSPQLDNQVLLIDRTNSALVWLDPSTCKVTQDLSVGTGFFSDPQDVVPISSTKAYVTRYQTNATPSGTAGANDQGDDLLIINPATMAITGRIDLAPQATTASGGTVQARPNRALHAGGKVYVSLDNSSADFMTSGPGRVVIVDPATDAVTGTIDLAPYANCGSALDYVASSQTLLIACVGAYTAADQLSQSALITYDLSGATPKMIKAYPASGIANRPLGFTLSAVSADEAVLGIPGDFGGPTFDALWSLKLSDGTATKIADADGSFTIGTTAVDSATKQVFVTNATMTTPKVSIYDVSKPGMFPEVSNFVSNPKSGLPPRAIGWY